MPRISSAFRLTGIEPDDLAWHAATEADRRGFWREAVRIGLRVKDESLARGLDRHGLKLKRVSRYTREHRRSAMGPANPLAPALMPAEGLSRTRAYLKGRAFADHAEFFWSNGWGRILHFHRVGARNHWARSGKLPVRDVIGLSQADENKIRREVLAWWKAKTKPPAKPKAPLVVGTGPVPKRKKPARPKRVPVAAKPLVITPETPPMPEPLPKVTPRNKPSLARRLGLFVYRTVNAIKSLFGRKPRGE